MPKISVQELAELVPCAPEQVRRLAELGILESPDGDDCFDSSQVHVVRLMAGFEAAGISLEDVGRGVRSGQLSFPLGAFMPEPAPIATTYEELAAEAARSPELVRRLSSEFGIAPGPDDRVRSEDAEILLLVLATLQLASDDDLSRFARLYGGSIARLVSAGIEFFDRVVRGRVGASSLSEKEKDAVTYEKGGEFTYLTSQVTPWLQRRHRERILVDYLVSLTEGFMDERGIAPRQPRQLPAIAFLDLSGYTALTEEHGDEAAAEVAIGVADVVQDVAVKHGGRPVKWLGDGVMMHFAQPPAAVISGLDLVEETERAISARARVGIDAGPVVVQEGDYFGRTVNVAARIADYAAPCEVLVSEQAREAAATADGVAFELVGDVALKGVPRPVRLHRVVRATEPRL
ncbi:MAG TPA: adenylate/guanylate cyclase domain-containing protein [Gaiellaceae bacterium]|nr:adenylate/guanylate cyclase domain-containing protein [Gaiellaceae bacterium]